MLWWRLVLPTALSLSAASGLYADQVGEFDWSIENIGRVHSVVFNRSLSPDALYAASDDRSRALVRLDSLTGAIQWRRVFAEGDAINAIHLTPSGLLSVSGAGRHVRLWDLETGTVAWDQVTHVPRAPPDVRFLGLFARNDTHVVVLTSSSLAMIQVQDGGIQRLAFPRDVTSAAREAPATISWQVHRDKLFLLAGSHTLTIDLVAGLVVDDGIRPAIPGVQAMTVLRRDNEHGHVVAVTLTHDELLVQGLAEMHDVNTAIPLDALRLDHETIVAIDETVPTALVVRLDSGKRAILRLSRALQVQVTTVVEPGGVLTGSTVEDAVVFHVTSPAASTSSIHVTSYALDPHVASSVSWETTLDLAPFGGAISRAFLECPSTERTCEAVVVLQDDALVRIATRDGTKGHVQWVRDEALANLKSVQWVTPAETEIEKQPLTHVPSFREEVELELKRLVLLVDTVRTFATSFWHDKRPPRGVHRSQAARKEPRNAHLFGFSKLIIVLTQSGKLVAIRAEARTVAWSVFMGPEYQLFVTRDHPALGAGPELLLVSNSSTLVWLDGETGETLRVSHANATTTQGASWVVLLPPRKHVASDHEPMARRMVAVIAEASLQASLYPDDLGTIAHPELDRFYFYRYDARAHALRGYSIETHATEASRYHARLAWSIVLPRDEAIVALAHRHDHAVVDSAVTITGDDSLLIKYLNPNLIGVATIATRDDDKMPSMLYVSLIDSVAGRILHRVRHAHASGPVQLVQSENWVVYSYWNARDKRTEMVSLALFEGAVGTYALNPWKRPFAWPLTRSSFDPKAPIVLAKSFIYPTKITSLGVTVTAHGITPPCVLVGMETGQIFQLSRSDIDPRQPERPLTPDEEAEGLSTYAPLVPVYNRPQAMVTSNRTVANVHDVRTAPAELESTTLVFASGLDLFYVRLTPAKSFDLLPSNFKHELLLLLCLAFLVATWVTKALAQRKALQLAWQ
ncbi:hypothetical protein PsorP6_003227 [Peronosclerospora sorghi]|uniref:Uncharacterized protein n=1 Tax=Peronosclerospora sorghi TaxID=230839 RepID=A0ACC0VR48_9STRA|nr:hypothetical protein PsorP6_003227 [Peronosclerospora sorghi]